MWKNEWTSASQNGAEIRNSLNARGKSGCDCITTCIIILFYLMRITCATIIVSRGLESTAECWTVWTGQRKVSGGRSVDSGGRARPLPTSVGRTLVLCPTEISRFSVSKWSRFYGWNFCMFTSDCEKRDDEVTIYMSKIVGGLIQRAWKQSFWPDLRKGILRVVFPLCYTWSKLNTFLIKEALL